MKRRVLLAVIVGALLLATGIVQRQSVLHEDRLRASEAAHADGRLDGVRHEPGKGRSDPGRTVSKRPDVAYTLPPEDVPLATVLPDLVAAAQAGSLPAKCRLSYELERCGTGAYWQRQYYEDNADRVLYSDEPPSEYALREYNRGQEDLARLDRICAGVVPPPGLKPWRLLRDAARAGHVPSMVRFATQFPGEPQGSLYDMEALVARRDESVGFLVRAAEAGDARATYDLFWGYAGNAGFPTFHQKDPKLALAYGMALAGIGNEETQKNTAKVVARLRRDLTPAEVQDAQRRAARLAPGLAYLVGRDLELRHTPNDSAEDCAWPDPHARPVKPPDNDRVRP